MSKVSSIRIVDPYVLELVGREMERSGESNPTKTAQRMIVERGAQQEILGRDQVAPAEPEPATSA